MKRIMAFASTLMLLLAANQMHADTVAKGACTVVLTVDVYKQTGEAEQEYVFTLNDLRMHPKVMFTTSTVWTDGEQEFAGLWMHTLLQHLNVMDGHIELVALNDYRISVPVSDFRSGGALLAYERNGSPMSARENGPLWLVYNYDSDADFRSESTYARSIWQLDRIIISR